MAELSLERSPIPGLLVLRIPVHEDDRGWFKENWQREKMLALGLPDFGPVQNNVSFNTRRGATRGIHAEPWDKLVSVATGRVFGAWVDLRDGPSFGTTATAEIDPGTIVFVPRGVGNAYQALEDGTAYTYLVNDHWRPGTVYPALDLADPTAAIPWPIPLSQADVSDKDRANPRLHEAVRFPPRHPTVLGAGGQVGRAVLAHWAGSVGLSRGDLDVGDRAALAAHDWGSTDVLVNAAAWTAVDEAETTQGRLGAWAANASAPAVLADVARERGLTLVHFSSDYVYDGTRPLHEEDEPLAPLGVYGQSKAAGDLAVAAAPRHYVLRTSWVVGDGHNFVRTMARLADTGVSPAVVADQVGRLTFTEDLARAAQHLVDVDAAPGAYHVTGTGDAASWADLAGEIFRLRGRDPGDVRHVSTEEYAAGAGRVLAPRPRHSTLDLAKVEGTGFRPSDQWKSLRAYVAALPPA